MTQPVTVERSEPAPLISLLELEVTDTRMRWELHHFTGEDRERIAGDTVSLQLSKRRRKTITMLSDLLRHAEDGKRRDALSVDLYEDLLRVVGHELSTSCSWITFGRRWRMSSRTCATTKSACSE